MDQPSFEKVLEADMARLAVEVQKHRENPETKTATDQELLKKSIAEFIPAPSAVAIPQSASATSPLPQYLNDASSETKLEVEYLLDIALKQGIERANGEAQKANPFVLDAFHDALAGKLYPELQKRGILK